MDIFETIITRRSVRRFTDGSIPSELVERVLEAGRWAPSGLNNQPWRFAVIEDKATREALSRLTRYSRIVIGAAVLIPVFLNTAESYNRVKDIQAVGACIENMLLEAHSLGLGAVWLGEILKSDREVRHVLGLGEELELMAVIAMGFPEKKPKATARKELKDLIVFRK